MFFFRVTGSVLGAFFITGLLCSLASVMGEKPKYRLPELISPVFLAPAPAREKNLVVKKLRPKKVQKFPESQKTTLKKEKIAPLRIMMAPLKMAAAPTMAVTMPVAPTMADARSVIPGPVGTKTVKTDLAAPGILGAASVDTPPRLKHYSPPLYPPRARGQNIEGKVVVRCVVSTGGKVMDARIIRAEPSGYFEKAALKSVKKWTFFPAELKGEKTAVYLDIPLSFSLD